MVKSAPDSVAAFLRPAARGDKSGELLVIPGWRQADWEALFSYAQRVHVGRGHVLIQEAGVRTGTLLPRIRPSRSHRRSGEP